GEAPHARRHFAGRGPAHEFRRQHRAQGAGALPHGAGVQRALAGRDRGMTVLGRVRALLARATPPRVPLSSARPAHLKVQRVALRELVPALPPENSARARITRGPFVIATSEQPRVSIVVPGHDRLAATLACLESLARTPVKTPFELIVVDAASDASIARLLEVFRGARSVRNAVSLGPLHAC